MTVLQRIQGLCDAQNISISGLEKKLGFANKSLYERDPKDPINIRSDRLLVVAQYFNVSTDWLLTGEEHGFQTFALTEREQNLIKMFRNLTEVGQDLLFAQYGVMANAGFVKKSADIDKVKVGD